VTVTDGDGDQISSTVNSSDTLSLSFTDTNPMPALGSFTVGGMSVTEASVLGNTVTFTPPTTTGGTAVDGISNTTIAYNLALAGTATTGLMTTNGNNSISLVVDSSSQISGKYDSDGDGWLDATAFTVVLSDSSVTLTSLVALEHQNSPAGSGLGNTLTLNNLIKVEATVSMTDGDGDVVSSTPSSASLNLSFVDTVPNAIDEVPQTLIESHVSDTDWLAGSVHLVSGTDTGTASDYTKITTITGLAIGDTLKIIWSGDNGTINWKLVDITNPLNILTGSSTSKTMSAILANLPVNGNYDLYVDYDNNNATKNIDITDVHVLHTVTTIDSGNVIIDNPGADVVGADGAHVSAITYTDGTGAHTVSVASGLAGTTVNTLFGVLTMHQDGSYTYTVNQNAVPASSQVTDNFTYTLMDGDGDTDTATMSYVINDVQAPSVLDVTMITNTNNEVQPVILTFVDQIDPHLAFSRLFTLNAQGQQGTYTPDTGFDINNSHNYVVGLEAATSETKVILTKLAIEGVTLFSGGTFQMQLDNGGGGSLPTGLVALIKPNNPPATQTLTASTDGTASTDSLTDATDGTVNYLYGADGNDNLTGSNGSEILNGGKGTDNVQGGGGNDILVYDKLDGNLDGGSGIDVLRIDDGAIALFVDNQAGGLMTQASVDLTGKSFIHDVEVLLITDDAEGSASKGTTLTLTANDVINFTDDAISGIDSLINHTLYINGNTSDVVQIGNGWVSAGTNGDFQTYTQTINNILVTLNVENGVFVI
jgi:VCBS repeat-containing protein